MGWWPAVITNALEGTHNWNTGTKSNALMGDICHFLWWNCSNFYLSAWHLWVLELGRGLQSSSESGYEPPRTSITHNINTPTLALFSSSELKKTHCKTWFTFSLPRSSSGHFGAGIGEVGSCLSWGGGVDAHNILWRNLSTSNMKLVLITVASQKWRLSTNHDFADQRLLETS